MEEIQAFRDGKVFSSKKNLVMERGRVVARVDSVFLRFNFVGLLSRLLRQKIHHVLPFDDGLIVTIKGKVIVYNSNGNVIWDCVLPRGTRPLKQGIDLLEGKVYFGDYWPNKGREPVCLRVLDTEKMHLQTLVEFPDVRHIHFVAKDCLEAEKLLVSTGDADNESRICQVDVRTGAIRLFQEGGQHCRAVSVIQIGTSLVWGSDSPDQDNYIYRLDRNGSGDAERLCKIAGPAYYSAKLKSGPLFISTGVENLRKHDAVIYRSVDGGTTWSICETFRKDRWSPKYFGYGLVEFPVGLETQERLAFNLQGLLPSGHRKSMLTH